MIDDADDGDKILPVLNWITDSRILILFCIMPYYATILM